MRHIGAVCGLDPTPLNKADYAALLPIGLPMPMREVGEAFRGLGYLRTQTLPKTSCVARRKLLPHLVAPWATAQPLQPPPRCCCCSCMRLGRRRRGALRLPILPHRPVRRDLQAARRRRWRQQGRVVTRGRQRTWSDPVTAFRAHEATASALGLAYSQLATDHHTQPTQPTAYTNPKP